MNITITRSKKSTLPFENLAFGTVFKVKSGEVMIKTSSGYFILTDSGGTNGYFSHSSSWCHPITEVLGRLTGITVE